MVITSRDVSTTLTDSSSGNIHLDSELTGQTLSGNPSMTWVNKRSRDDGEPIGDAEFTEDLIICIRSYCQRTMYSGLLLVLTFGSLCSRGKRRASC